METALLASSWTLLVVKTFLVADNLCERHGYDSVLRLLSVHCRYRQDSSGLARHSSTSGHSGASKFRLLHFHLLLAHITACISTGASFAREILHMTDTSCFVTLRLFAAMGVLHQAFLVLFLEAKTDVTNVTGGDPANAYCWARLVRLFARCWGYVYQPISAIVGAYANLSDGLDEEHGTCQGMLSGTNEEQLNRMMGWYIFAQLILVILLALLLVIFILPLVSTRWSGLSLTVSYRRVIIRNSVCGALITLLISARVLTSALILPQNHDCSEQQCSRWHLVGAACTQALTLCLTEITIPIGFSSCISTITRPHAASLRPLESGDMATSAAAVAPTEPSNSKSRQSWASGCPSSINCGAGESPRPNVIVTGVDSI